MVVVPQVMLAVVLGHITQGVAVVLTQVLVVMVLRVGWAERLSFMLVMVVSHYLLV